MEKSHFSTCAESKGGSGIVKISHLTHHDLWGSCCCCMCVCMGRSIQGTPRIASSPTMVSMKNSPSCQNLTQLPSPPILLRLYLTVLSLLINQWSPIFVSTTPKRWHCKADDNMGWEEGGLSITLCKTEGQGKALLGICCKTKQSKTKQTLFNPPQNAGGGRMN